ncbi:MAG TPA: helicase-related protein [Methylocella sp.]|jgi:ATP-dependent RNA helicase SUPV3L1/SUV3
MNISFPATKVCPLDRARGVTVLLGPTNTGKTHYAIERMLSHSSGMIGLPLRLLAREVYNRAVEKVGTAAVALITGEEKIKPESPRYWVSTVEAMPRGLDLAFVAVDEIQLGADLDRGHVFTDRLLHWRGRDETLLIGSATMHAAVRGLLPGARIFSRPRLSRLSFAGDKKMTRLPRRSAIVAFSVEDVYAIAEWIRRQRGGAAVVLGALSPRTRNAQVDMYQNGDVDYIVATDAIGMGLNLDVDHIAFAAARKFDGWQHRRLTPAEFGQIAGRAGRHLRDGTFGTTGRCAPFDAGLVEALEEHRFDPVQMLQWRNTDLDFSSLAGLAASLDILPKGQGLIRAPLAEDQMVLDVACRDEQVVRAAKTRADIARLWECCQIPDYRKLSPAAHAELVLSVFGYVVRAGQIPDDWFARHVAAQDRVDGDLDTLSARLAEIRTWTFIANRSGWLRDPAHWQNAARRVEDRLSDALHERLAQRFVDRRTSVLMRRLRENAMLEAEVTPKGDVLVEGQHVGQLSGFRFTADPAAAGEAAKALNAAAQKALASEIEGRAVRVSEAVDEAFILAYDGIIRWLGEPIGQICAGAHVLEPRVSILADEQLTGQALAMVQRRLEVWLAQHVAKLLGPLADLEKGEGLDGIARGIAFQTAESLGVLDRARVADEVKSLSQDARAALRKFGVRFGAYHLYLPNLIKPAPRALAAQLYALKHFSGDAVKGLDDVLHLAASGRTSLAAGKDVQRNLYRAAGFRVCEDRAVRVDILERLADLIRPAVSYRPGVSPGDPPPGAADGDGFVVTVAMTSLAGCSGDSFASILRALGYVSEHRKGPAITVPLLAVAQPLAPHAAGLEPTPECSVEAGPNGHVTEQAAEPAGDAVTRPAANPDAATSGLAGPAVLSGASPAGASGAETSESGAAETGEAKCSPEPLTVEESLIEIWRPHRPHHHARRLETRTHKRHFERREGTPVACATATLETAVPMAVPNGTAAAEPPAGEGAGKEALAEVRLQRNAIQDRRKEGGERGGGEQRPRFGGQRGRKPAGEQHRGGAGELRERGLSAREKKLTERPPDPDSPFAKLLPLKARLEEKNNQDR